MEVTDLIMKYVKAPQVTLEIPKPNENKRTEMEQRGVSFVEELDENSVKIKCPKGWKILDTTLVNACGQTVYKWDLMRKRDALPNSGHRRDA